VLRVPFSLGTFSWASKRKYLVREDEIPGQKYPLEFKLT